MIESDFKFLGDAHGQLLPDDQLTGKLDEAIGLFNAITDPDSAHAAVEEMSFGDIIQILQNHKVNYFNVFRIFGAEPRWAARAEGAAIIEESTRVIALLEVSIPDDIKDMVDAQIQKHMSMSIQ